jgi:predicted PurR-regulated permease PerM
VAALEFSGIGQLLAIGVLYAVVPFLDALFVTPNIVGNRVGLPPLVVLLGIVAFGDLFGVVGILIAVPTLAVARIVSLEILHVYKGSSMYLGI